MMKKILILSCLLFSTFILLSDPETGLALGEKDRISIRPFQVASILSNQTDTLQDNSTYGWVGRFQDLTKAYILMQFDIPRNISSFKNASLLTFTHTSIGWGKGDTLIIYPITEQWDEKTVTWNNAPKYDRNRGINVTSLNKIDVTELVRAWPGEYWMNFGFIITGDTAGYVQLIGIRPDTIPIIFLDEVMVHQQVYITHVQFSQSIPSVYDGFTVYINVEQDIPIDKIVFSYENNNVTKKSEEFHVYKENWYKVIIPGEKDMELFTYYYQIQIYSEDVVIYQTPSTQLDISYYKSPESTPGFEIISFLLGVMLILYYKQRSKKQYT